MGRGPANPIMDSFPEIDAGLLVPVVLPIPPRPVIDNNPWLANVPQVGVGGGRGRVLGGFDRVPPVGRLRVAVPSPAVSPRGHGAGVLNFLRRERARGRPQVDAIAVPARGFDAWAAALLRFNGRA